MTTTWDAPCGCRGIILDQAGACSGCASPCELHAPLIGEPPDWQAFRDAVVQWCRDNQPPEEPPDE